jgi:hypothetical protein
LQIESAAERKRTKKYGSRKLGPKRGRKQRRRQGLDFGSQKRGKVYTKSKEQAVLLSLELISPDNHLLLPL